VKRKIRIFAVIVAAAIGLAAGENMTDEKVDTVCKEILSQDENDASDYTDFNNAYISCTGGCISSARTLSANAVPRHLNSAKRSFCAKDAASGKSGKSLTLHSVVDFNALIGLFPSGLNSRSHSFIRMCKLTI